ncbi:hypothetical protein GCM10009087_34020 [Sphingomonas oligophenolica]|uniref:YdbH domain-containing protein n=1 Tax=Sphingomonas oligophenolica TaxID=301154 RepID=A0ABU9XYV7_9SPHN
MLQSGVADGVTANEREVPEHQPRLRGWRRTRAIALGIALILLVALIALWSQRKPIASNYIDKALAQRGVPARYTITDLGLNRQRLTGVVIGDPLHPDLVADWVELRTGVGLSGFGVTAIRAGHVRISARLVNGKLSLGALDKLMPAPSGKPFTLPGFVADIEDARMRLVAPQGVIGLKLSGKGRLNGGFRGQLAAVSERLDLGGCITGRVSGEMAIRIDNAAPTIEGPAQLASFACGDTLVRGAGADMKVALSEALDRWRGQLRLSIAEVRHPQGSVSAVTGSAHFAGSAKGISGDVALQSAEARSAGLRASSARLSGTFRLAGAARGFEGSAGASDARVDRALLARISSYAGSAAGTPMAPLARKIAGTLTTAGRSFTADAHIVARMDSAGGMVSIDNAAMKTPGGARATLSGGAGVSYGWPGPGLRVDGQLATSGGGLPEARIDLKQAAPGAPITGTAVFQPYAADGARLALAPVVFTATPGGLTRLSTRIILSGPLGDGRVDNLSLPVTALWNGHDRLQVNRDCAPLAFDRLAVSGLVLRPARTMLCPVEGALVRIERGRMGGGARTGAVSLGGALGSTPIGLAWAGADLRLADRRFALSGMGVRIGTPDRLTRLDFAALDGRMARGVIDGRFSSGGGQIANVPLLLSAADGTWALHDSRLEMKGALQVADADPNPRLKPIAAREVSLTLIDSKIAVTGKLVQPAKGVDVADVAIFHDLKQGGGHADLIVPGLIFNDHFQPDELTRLTFGVIADVAGTVAGDGHIRWTPDGVTSDGAFRTAGLDLAAAFGPVTGIAGEVRFTDLLNLETAPGQIATVKTVNPGIAVNDGTIRYQLLAGARVQVEEGNWPFAGGSLRLEPTLLDFGESRERHLTFNVTGMDAGQFLQQFAFKNLNATGVFDGSLPMIFDEKGGRIENGHLVVRPGGGTIAYVGEVSQKDVGFWGNFAFQALKSLRYRNLDIVMNGPLAGEMITEVRFAGVGQGQGAKRNFILDRLQKLPLVFNVRIKAPFRGLIDSAQSFYDPKRLIARNLPALLEEQKKRATPPKPVPAPIQPPESRKMP